MSKSDGERRKIKSQLLKKKREEITYITRIRRRRRKNLQIQIA
jgi:hypothetical protein